MEETLHQLTDDGYPVIPWLNAQVLIRPWWVAGFLNHQQYTPQMGGAATWSYISFSGPWDDPYSVMSETLMRTWDSPPNCIKLVALKRLGCKQESLVVSSWRTKWKTSLNKLSFFLSDLFNTFQSNCHLIGIYWCMRKQPCNSGTKSCQWNQFLGSTRGISTWIYKAHVWSDMIIWYFRASNVVSQKLILLIARDESRPCVTLLQDFWEPRNEFVCLLALHVVFVSCG